MMETKKGRFNLSTEALLVALLLLFVVAPGPALPQTPFYQGKTITFITGSNPGELFDVYVRTIGQFIVKNITGNPGMF